jgi:hypothetical protein
LEAVYLQLDLLTKVGFLPVRFQRQAPALQDYNLVIAPKSSGEKFQQAMENVKHFNGGNLFSY